MIRRRDANTRLTLEGTVRNAVAGLCRPLVLQSVQLSTRAAAFHQVVVSAVLCNHAVRDDDDLVCVALSLPVMTVRPVENQDRVVAPRADGVCVYVSRAC